MKDKICKHCDKEFSPNHPKQIFCSSDCRIKSFRSHDVSAMAIVEIPEAEKKNIRKAIKEMDKKEKPVLTEKDLRLKLLAECPAHLLGIDRSIWLAERTENLK